MKFGKCDKIVQDTEQIWMAS